MNENGYFYGQEELVCVCVFFISEFQLKYKLDAVVMLLSTKKAIFILLRTKSQLTFYWSDSTLQLLSERAYSMAF